MNLQIGQLKSFENSFILLNGPRTLKGPGEWTLTVLASFIASEKLFLNYKIFKKKNKSQSCVTDESRFYHF